MKRCSYCKKDLPISNFSRSGSAKDNLMHRCKKCNRKVAKAHYEDLYGTKRQREEEQTKLFNYIRQLKKEGWTLKDIADEVSLDESSISYYLSGRRQVGTQAVKKFKVRMLSANVVELE